MSHFPSEAYKFPSPHSVPGICYGNQKVFPALNPHNLGPLFNQDGIDIGQGFIANKGVNHSRVQ